MNQLHSKYFLSKFILMVCSLLVCGLTIFSYSQAANITETNFYDTPLYTFSGKTNNITMPLSVEFPIAGSAWGYPRTTVGGYDATEFNNTSGGSATSGAKNQISIGYFNHALCYTYNGDYFVPSVLTNNGECGSGFSGNFLNWATHSTLDLLRYSLTGGSRYIDEPNLTVLKRAKTLGNADRLVPTDAATLFYLFPMRVNNATNVAPTSHKYAASCGTKIYFSASSTLLANSNCSLLGAVLGVTSYNVRVQVCDALDASLRPEFCTKYPNGNYKPEGVLQKNSANSRFSLLSYLNLSPALTTIMQANLAFPQSSPGMATWNKDLYTYMWGGVLRANARFIGNKNYDVSLNFTDNNQLEWNTLDGTLNMDASHERVSTIIQPKTTTKTLITGNESVANGTSIINYINEFGFYDTYRNIDAFSELLGESMRYLGNYSAPSNEGQINGSDVSSMRNPLYIYNRIKNMGSEALKLHTDTFPFLSSWNWTANNIDNPIRSVCEKDSSRLITIADINNWRSKYYGSGASWHSTALGSADNNFFNGISLQGVIDSINSIMHASTSPLSQSIFNDIQFFDIIPGYTQNRYISTGILAGANLYGIKYQNDSDITVNKVKSTVIDVGEKAHNSVGDDSTTDCHLYTAGVYGANSATQITNFINKGNSCSNWTQARESQNITNMNNALPNQGYFYPSNPNALIDNIKAAFRSPVAVSGNISAGVLQDNDFQSNGKKQVFLFKNNLSTKADDLDTSISTQLKKYEVYLDTDNTVKTKETDVTNAWEGNLKDSLRGTQYNGSGFVTKERNIILGGAVNKDINGNVTSRNSAREFTYTDINRTNDIDRDALNSLSIGLASKQVFNLSKEDLLQKRINYFRGKQDDEQTDNNQNQLFRKRNFLLGSSANSTPVYFPQVQTNGKNMLYIGTNEGMMHGIEADSGIERFAFIPRNLLPKIYEYGEKNYVDKPLMESTPIVRTIVTNTFNAPIAKTILASGMGAGAKGIFAVDVSKLHNTGTDINKSDILFEFTEQDDKDMGHLIGSPEFVSFKTGTATNNFGKTVDVIETFIAVTSGYNNTSSNTVYDAQGRPQNSLYLYFLNTNKTYGQKWVENTNYIKVKISDAIANNGITAPNVIGYGSRSFFIYMGDLQGNLWRYSSLITPNVQAIFTTKNEANLMPISAKPTVTTSPSTGFMIAFGTGKYMGLNDLGANQRTQQALFAIHDNLNITTTYTLSDLTQRTANGNSISGSTSSNKGWYINLPRSTSQGERITLSPIIRDGRVLASSQILGSFNKNSCGAIGGSTINVDLLNGTGDYLTITNKFVGRLLIMPPMSLIDTQGVQGTARNSVKNKKDSILNVLIGGATTSEDSQTPPTAESFTNNSLTNYVGNNQGILSWREIVDAKLP